MPPQDVSSSFAVIIDVTVHDEDTLFSAAFERYCGDNGQCATAHDDAFAMLKPGGDIDVSPCLQILLDPGVSPPGCQIAEFGRGREPTLTENVDWLIGWRDLIARAGAMLYRAKAASRGQHAGLA